MKEQIIFQMSSPYRDDFRIRSFRFGDGKDTIAVVGTMRGDETQQQYVCASLVKALKDIESRGNITNGKSILVIPSCNPSSMNVKRRFWAMDNTDINRMFPGYDKGETTQRIAATVFEAINKFEYGIQLASFYVPGDFVPHVRMLKTGYENTDYARLFGLPYITLRQPLPFDTGLLNYNWQVWGSKAFSLYSGHTATIDASLTKQSVEAMLRFMFKSGILQTMPVSASGYDSIIVDENNMVNVKTTHAGILKRMKTVGELVYANDVIAQISDPYDSTILEEIKSPTDGVIFFMTTTPLVLQNQMLCRII